MKNRKFIQKIIFSILLFLCVCVPFLVHKNNVKAQTEITDLTNTTWQFNSTLTTPSSRAFVYNTTKNTTDFVLKINLVDNIHYGYCATTSSFLSNGFYALQVFDSVESVSISSTENSISIPYTILANSVITFYDNFLYTNNFLDWLQTNATLVRGFNLTLEEYEENDISFSSSSNFYYSINNTGFFVPLITSDNNLPYTINEVSLITFKNENIENDLVLYDRITFPVSILTIVEPGQQYTLEITEDLTLWLGQAPSDNPIPPTPGETNVVSGGYRFNTLVSSSIFGDINEQELDILFEENFYLFGDTSRSFDMFTLHTENPDGTGAQYFCYENSLTGDFVYAGVVSSNKSYISIFTSYRTIEWETQYVSPEVYTYLIDNGNFGDYEIPPSEPSPDNPLGWLIDNVNDFLQIEILPGLPIIWLIQFALIVPLCMIVLKMYFGG